MKRTPAIPAWKRAMDIVFAAAALVLTAPLWVAAAALVKLSSRGPVFYVAPRAGVGGRPFGQLKFRTMHLGADRAGAFTAAGDPRVFPTGRLLRLFKIDELPQLWNVLRGEMSIVGPRPEDLETVRRCYTPAQMRVLDVPPGLTGIPQVLFYPEPSFPAADAQDYYRRVFLPMRLELDLDYVRRCSPALDLELIGKTAWLILVKSWAALPAGERSSAVAAPGMEPPR